jgi:ferredoxin
MPSQPNQPIITVIVLDDTCVRSGLCTEICPEVFEFPPPSSDNPSPAVRVRNDAHRHYQTHDEPIRQAAKECPVHAIVLEHGP